ncbi:MAG TPA: ABC transporter permease [Solirubrobacteraceae bacterium]
MSTPPPPTGMPVRATQVLRVRKIWLLPLTIAAVFVALMSVIYFGSVVNPTGHMRGMPVMVVDEDTGATVHGQRIDVGASLVHALQGSSGVSSRLALRTGKLAQAHARMDQGGAYATLVIPATLSRSVLLSTGTGRAGAGVPAKGSVELLENSRLGSLGVNLVAGVATKAVASFSPRVATKIKPLVTPTAAANPVMAAQNADPVSLTTAGYRPLPDHSALGLSAFYVALLSIMAGFIGATLINSSIDSGLGYGATEFGPRWRQRRPVPINRRQTLLVKWSAAVIAAPVLTGILLLVSAGLLHMYAPDPLLLWLLMAFAALMISTGTLALLATVGSIGQLLAMILLVYLSLASSGGTVPIQALPGFFGAVAHVEPLRQVLLGTRAIMYFGARGDAGLTHSLILIGCELAFWALLGLAVTSWYDHKKLYRLTPDLFGSISRAIDSVARERAAAAIPVATDETSLTTTHGSPPDA